MMSQDISDLHSVSAARCDSLIQDKSPANGVAQLTKVMFRHAQEGGRYWDENMRM